MCGCVMLAKLFKRLWSRMRSSWTARHTKVIAFTLHSIIYIFCVHLPRIIVTPKKRLRIVFA